MEKNDELYYVKKVKNAIDNLDIELLSLYKKRAEEQFLVDIEEKVLVDRDIEKNIQKILVDRKKLINVIETFIDINKQKIELIELINKYE